MFAGISFHLPENVLGHFLTCRSADSNFFLSFHLLKNLYPPVFLKDAAEYRMLVGSTFPPSSPFTVLLHCPLTCTVSKEKSAVIPIFVPPWVVFSLSASKVSSLVFSSVHVVSRWEFFCLLVCGLQPPGCLMCVYYRLLGSIAALLPGSTEGRRM